jgi:hypothetical protein
MSPNAHTAQSMRRRRQAHKETNVKAIMIVNKLFEIEKGESMFSVEFSRIRSLLSFLLCPITYGALAWAVGRLAIRR